VSQISKFFSPNSLFLISRGLLFCMLSVIHHCIMADLKKQRICIKFCFKLTKTASRSRDKIWVYTHNPETKQWSCWKKNLPLHIQRKWGKSGQTSTCLCYFLLLRHCSSGICSWSPNSELALQHVGLATFEGASQPKAFRIMDEPGLADWPGWCVGAHCFVTAAVFDNWNTTVTLVPSLPY